MDRRYGFIVLLAVVAVSVVFGMVLGGRLNAPPTMLASSPSALGALAPPPGTRGPLVDFADIAEAAIPAVVSVANTQVGRPERGGVDPHDLFRNDPFYRWFFGPQEEQRERRSQPQRRLGFGSGFIISEDGYILTNNHVVDETTRLEVTLNDGSKFEAKVIGVDPSIDLALIKIDPKGKTLSRLALGDSDSLRVGEWVIAIGNPLNFEYTVTVGVVSAKKRRVPIGTTDSAIANYIQTDAAINFGNSGGPLLDARGRVIGINTAIHRSNLAEGIGFALPINEARNVVEQLRETGTVKRGFIGITMNPTGINESAREYYGLPDGKGVIVQDVQPDGPAARAGIKRGDVIRKVDGETVEDNLDLVGRIASRRPGEKVGLELFRDGRTVSVSVTLASRPDPQTARRGLAPRPGPSDEEEGVASGLGIQVEPLTESVRQRLQLPARVQGVLVTEVEIGSEAADRGIDRDMVVTAVNDQTIKGLGDWKRVLRGLKVGTPVKLDVTVSSEQSFYVFLRVPEKGE